MLFEQPPQEARHRQHAWLVVALAAAIVACYAVATESLVLGSVRGRWTYRYIHPLTYSPFVVCLIASLPALALLRVGGPRSVRGEWMLVAAWIALASLLQAILRWLTPYSFETIFLSPGANSFYTATLQQDASVLLSDFSRVREQLPLHAQSNMPGKLLLVYALELLSQRPDVLPWLLLGLSNLGAAFMYLFVRDLFDDRTTALYAAILYLFVPSKLFFFPLLNTVTPVLVLAYACLVSRWVQRPRAVHAVGLGLMLYVLVIFEPVPLVMGLVFASLVARALSRGTLSWSCLISHGRLIVLVFAGAVVLMHRMFGFELFRAFAEVRAHAVAFNATERRPYDIWIRANLVEFAFGMGVCQAVLFWAALTAGLRGPVRWVERLARPITVVSLALLATLMTIDLIGISRGEVIRLWIFLACFFQIPAAFACARLQPRVAIAFVLCATLLQGALGTAMIGFIVP